MPYFRTHGPFLEELTGLLTLAAWKGRGREAAMGGLFTVNPGVVFGYLITCLSNVF